MPIAIGAIAGVDVIVTAVMGLILLYSLLLFIQAVGAPIAALVENVPVVGGDLADAIRSGVSYVAGRVQGFVSGLAQNVVQPIEAMFNVVAQNLRTSAYWAAYAIAQVGNATLYYGHQIAAGAYQALENWVLQIYNTITTWAYNALVTVQNNVVTYVQQYISVITTWAQQEFQRDYQNVQQVVQDLASAEQTLYQDIMQVEQQTEEYAQQLYNQGTQYTQQIVTQTEQALSDEFTQGYNQLANTIVQTQQWVQGQLQQETQYIDGQVGQVVSTIAEHVLPAINAIDSTIEKCLDPMCDNGPDFFNGFKTLLGLLTAFDLAQFLADAAHNPEPVAQQINREVNDLISEPYNIVKDVLGV